MSAQVAAGIIRNADGRILIAERFDECPYGGRWEFPGGTLEEGETLQECLQRELEEELGIRIRIDEPFVVIERPYASPDISLHTFLCTHIGGDPTAIECNAWRWVDSSELREANLTGADREVLKALEELWAEQG